MSTNVATIMGTKLKTTVHQRLAQLIKALGLTNNSFAMKIDTYSTNIYNITDKQRNGPSFDMLAKIATVFPDVNVAWLLTGEGSMFFEKENGKVAIAEGYNHTAELLEKMKKLEEMLEVIKVEFVGMRAQVELAANEATTGEQLLELLRNRLVLNGDGKKKVPKQLLVDGKVKVK